jgi:prepilin-type N-terminal cleavage/methylation domain-containing protein
MHRRHAFTLFEMAIVIVIVGLLMGGLVAGRTYVKNAELTGIINESKYYMNVFGQFQQKYGAVPGDLADATSQLSTTYNGDGNGQIMSSDNGGSIATPEIFYAFEQLNHAKLIDGSYTGESSGGGGTLYAKAGVNIPRSSFPDSALMFDHPDDLDGDVSGDGFYFDGLYGHVIRVAKISPTSTTLANTAMLTPIQTLSLDAKFDDSRPGTGWLMTPNHTALSSCTNSDNPTTSDYSVSNKSPACYLILKVQ